MDPVTYQAICTLVLERSGIRLPAGKESLVSARVGKRLRALRIGTEREYLAHVLADPTGGEVVHLLDAITTNVTHFFREPAHFTALQAALEAWVVAGQRRLRMWSAACSTGEEPYSMAMTARELERLRPGWLDVKVLATDLCTRVLALAQAGRYAAAKVENVPPRAQAAGFIPVGRGADEREIAPAVRQLVTFRRLNLAAPPFPMQGPFDVIFCRNVMIYFDDAVRARLVREMIRLLRPGGLLMIGHSENLLGAQCDELETVSPSVYRKATPA